MKSIESGPKLCILEDPDLQSLGTQYLTWKALGPGRDMTFQQFITIMKPRLSSEWVYLENRKNNKLFGGKYV